MSVLAIIPARGGSKGIPRKNLREVGGKSLLLRAIEACQQAGGIDRIFVSTDDREIADASVSAGVPVPVLRPDDLASDEAPTLPVLQHAIGAVEASGDKVTVVVLIEPTSPFRDATHIAAALSRFAEGDCASVASVTPLERKPENIFVKDRTLRRYIEKPAETFRRRQEMTHLCRLNSAIYVTGRDPIMAGALLPAPIGWIEMDALSSLNIDTPVDLAVAQFLAGRFA